MGHVTRAAERNRGARGKNFFGGPIMFSRQQKKTPSYIACSPTNAALCKTLVKKNHKKNDDDSQKIILL